MKYRITTVLKVETDIITSFRVSLTGLVMMLVIIYVETFKIEVIRSSVRSTEELVSSPVRRRRPMLTFAFRFNVDKLLGPG